MRYKFGLVLALMLALVSTSAVATAAPDTEPPVMHSLTGDPAQVSIYSSGALVSFEATITDDLSGVLDENGDCGEICYPTGVELRSPSGTKTLFAFVSRVSGDLFRARMTIPRYSETGTWVISYVQLTDNAGNMDDLFAGDLEAQGLQASVEVTEDPPLNVTKDGNGGGTVTSSPSGIDCGATCSASFDTGTSATLTATPNATSTFTGWSGAGCSGTGICTVSMDQARSVTATFTKLRYSLTVTKSGTGSGTVTSNDGGINCGATCSNSYDHGTVVTLTATPAASSSFTGWSGACTGTVSCQVTMDQARSVTATFTLAQESSTVSTFGFKAKKRLFSGTVQLDADHPDCRTGRKVRLMKARPGQDATAGRSTSNDSGKWSVKVGRRTKGAFYALIAKNVIPAGDGPEVTCSRFRTKTINIKPA